MSKTNTQLVEESPQYKKLLGMFLRQRRKIRSMQKSATTLWSTPMRMTMITVGLKIPSMELERLTRTTENSTRDFGNFFKLFFHRPP